MVSNSRISAFRSPTRPSPRESQAAIRVRRIDSDRIAVGSNGSLEVVKNQQHVPKRVIETGFSLKIGGRLAHCRNRFGTVAGQP